ncbi:WecB/TagA/CpsF family glycosyltransferase [Candidatus Poribacteria bacterium]|nr:WecB/TagA/CpsF family glycosyltransferase [Candidatus Poribacteria bacterium]
MMRRPDLFFGVPVAALTPDEFIEQLFDWAVAPHDEDRGARVVTYLNAHTTNLLNRWESHRAALGQADLVYADGMAVVEAVNRLGGELPERVNAGDFLLRFLWAADRRGIGIGLLGSEEDVVHACARNLESEVPGLRLRFVNSGHFDASEPDTALLPALRDSRTQILLVGMGSPRQELWSVRHRLETGAAVHWCVGALFEYFSGTRERAPVWMREAGLEWLFRLALEPGRLGARYLVGNIEFLWRAHRQEARLRARGFLR